MPKTPLLTIGIPTYNNAAFLKKTLARVSRMLSPDVECVVSDNASTDDTRKVAMAFCKKDRRIRYFCNATNEGMYANFDRVVKRSRTKYVLFLSDDDVLDKKGVLRVLQIIRAHPNIALVRMNLRSKGYEKFLPRLSGDKILSLRQFVRLDAYTTGGISGLAVNRKLWLTTRCRTHHEFTIIEKCLRMAGRQKKGVYVLDEPFIFVYDPPEGRRWAREPLKTFRLVYVLQPNVLLGLQKDGLLEKSDLERHFGIITREMHLYLVNMQGRGHFIDRATLGDLVRTYGKRPLFWALWPLQAGLLALPKPLKERMVGVLRKAYATTRKK
jgi:glycosyltransferase involved in cell wall biosynthesis